MENDLSSLFAEQQSNEINWNGPVFSLYELPTTDNLLTVRFVTANTRAPQGLRLKIRGGTFEVESTTSKDLVLWQDSAPLEVLVSINWGRSEKRSLRIWNAWRVKGVTQAWLGNSGMRVCAVGGGVFQLRCSDGEGEPDFDNLVAEVRLR